MKMTVMSSTYDSTAILHTYDDILQLYVCIEERKRGYPNFMSYLSEREI